MEDNGTDVSVPTGVRVASVLLLLIVVGGAIGIAFLLRHVFVSFHQEPASHRADDIALLAERTLQWLTAGFALWAVHQRRPLGRWLTASLAFYLAIKVVLGFRGAVQAIVGNPDTVSRIPFTTPVEGIAGVLFAGMVALVLTAIASSMVFNAQVREYFHPK